MAKTEITYQVTGLAELIQKTSASVLLGPPLRKGLTTSALLLQAEAQRLVPVDTGNLRRTITHRVDSDAVPLFAIVGTNAPYAQAVHDGRRKGAAPPPVRALMGWAGRHGIPAGRVFLIARAIGRKGIKGRPFMTDALKAVRGKIDGALTTAKHEIEAIWKG